jgi:ubiquinone/menaquinone biosynthesis C-methylase UbiE
MEELDLNADVKQEEVANWFRQDGATLLRRLGVRPGQRILDVGCGFGSYAVPLAQVVAPDGRVIAVDTDAEAIERLKERLAGAPYAAVVETHLTGGEVEFSWIAAQALDAALLFDVLQHIDDWEKLFAELRRVVKRAGRVYVNPSTLSHPGQVDVARMGERLEAHGFRLQRRGQFRLMHYKRMAEDEVYVFSLTTAQWTNSTA